jgi:hypothetical protein
VKHLRLSFAFAVSAILLLVFCCKGADAQIPSASGPQKEGCANGVRCGETFTTTDNGIIYDCRCNCSGQDDCTPRSSSGASVPGRQSEDNSAMEAEQERRQQEQEQKKQRKEQEMFEKAKNEAFTSDHENLMQGLKGRPSGPPSGAPGAPGALSLHSGTGTTSLPLKDGHAGPPATGLKTSNTQALKTGDEAKAEQEQFETMNAAWMKNQKQLFEQRLQEGNLTAAAIRRSFTTNAPPPLFERKFDELQPGDVLLIAPNDILGKAVMWGDKLASFKFRGDLVHDNLSQLQGQVKDEFKNGAPFSHTVIYLKTVNGRKWFLDNRPFEGPRILTEEEFLGKYSQHEIMVAALAQPLNPKEGDDLWKAARQLALRQKVDSINNANSLNPMNHLHNTNYGPWGQDMVCSEASRWALIKAGRQIPLTDDQIKRKLGIDYSPADFLNSEYFIVTELKGMPKAPAGEK